MGTHNLAKTSDEKRQAIRSLLARGMTIKAITETVKCSSHTVTAVREMDAEPIGEEQAILARKWNNVGQLAVEQLQDRLAQGEKPTLQQLSSVGAVAGSVMSSCGPDGAAAPRPLNASFFFSNASCTAFCAALAS